MGSGAAAGSSGGVGATQSGGVILKPEALQSVLAEAVSTNVFSSMFGPSPPPSPSWQMIPSHTTLMIPCLDCCVAPPRLLSTSGELISCAGERVGEELVSAIVASVWKTVRQEG